LLSQALSCGQQLSARHTSHWLALLETAHDVVGSSQTSPAHSPLQHSVDDWHELPSEVQVGSDPPHAPPAQTAVQHWAAKLHGTPSGSQGPMTGASTPVAESVIVVPPSWLPPLLLPLPLPPPASPPMTGATAPPQPSPSPHTPTRKNEQAREARDSMQASVVPGL
jgi:hypothetical protein